MASSRDTLDVHPWVPTYVPPGSHGCRPGAQENSSTIGAGADADADAERLLRRGQRIRTFGVY
jgi:hypothetical protein